MPDLEDRLVDLGRSFTTTHPPGALLAPPRATELVARARRRRTRRTAAIGLAAALTAIALAAELRPDTTSTTNLASTTAADGRAPTPSGAAAPRPAAVPEFGPGVWVVGVDGGPAVQVGKDSGPTAWSPDGDQLAIAVDDWIWKLRVDDPSDASVVPVGAAAATCLTWSSRGDLAWVTTSGELRVQPTGTDQVERRTKGFARTRACRWAPDGEALALDGDGLTVLHRDGREVGRWPSTRGDLAGVRWSPDGSRVVTVQRTLAEPDRLLVVDVARGAPVTLPSPDGRAIQAVEWTATGAALLVESDATHALVDVVDGRSTVLTVTCCRHLQPLEGGDYLALSSTVASSTAFVVLSRDLGAATPLARATDPTDPTDTGACPDLTVVELVPSPDGRRVAIVGSC
jgi:dipeptidyl aminopeptidase/acylaminoacyl peptidase